MYKRIRFPHEQFTPLRRGESLFVFQCYGQSPKKQLSQVMFLTTADHIISFRIHSPLFI